MDIYVLYTSEPEGQEIENNELSHRKKSGDITSRRFRISVSLIKNEIPRVLIEFY